MTWIYSSHRGGDVIDWELLSRVHDLEGLIPNDGCDTLAELASTVPSDRAIVEIGVYKGKSLAALAAGAKAAGTRVYGVDIFDSIGVQGRHTVPVTFAAEVVVTLNLTNVALRTDRSVNVARAWKGPPVGLLHIDGNHRYHTALSDIDAWRPHLASDAVIVFDDYNRKQAGVKRAVNERFGRPDEILVERLAVVRVDRLPL